MIFQIEENLLPANEKTLRRYYDSVEQGDFLDILDTLADDITYVISGDPFILPFSGEWVGKASVTKLFQAFGDAFQLLHLSENLVINCGDRVISCNDESFAVFKTGLFYRVPVLHIAEFNSENKIVRFLNLHDTSTAEQAFAGRDPALVSIMPPAPAPIANTPLTEAELASLAKSLVGLVFEGHLPADQVEIAGLHLYVPGLSHRSFISGVWTGTLLRNEYPERAAKFCSAYNLQKGGTIIDRVTLSQGQVAVEGHLNGRSDSWAITAQLNGKSIATASLFIDTATL
jgi:ketosteroid isomerase-like protein